MIDSSDLTFAKAQSDGMRRESSGAVHIPEGGLVLEDVEKKLIVEALQKTEGNQSAAARLLGISRQTLIYRMQKHAIRGS